MVLLSAGMDTSAALLATWCGSSIPTPVVSSGRFILLHFSSDSDTNTGSGFKIGYNMEGSG